MVFSSSATVYGQPDKIPCVEDFELKAMNPYGRTKVCLIVKLFIYFSSLFLARLVEKLLYSKILKLLSTIHLLINSS